MHLFHIQFSLAADWPAVMAYGSLCFPHCSYSMPSWVILCKTLFRPCFSASFLLVFMRFLMPPCSFRFVSLCFLNFPYCTFGIQYRFKDFYRGCFSSTWGGTVSASCFIIFWVLVYCWLRLFLVSVAEADGGWAVIVVCVPIWRPFLKFPVPVRGRGGLLSSRKGRALLPMQVRNLFLI